MVNPPKCRNRHHRVFSHQKARPSRPPNHRVNSNPNGRKGKWPKWASLLMNNQTTTYGTSRHMQETPAMSAAYEPQGIWTNEANPPKDSRNPSNWCRDNLFTLDIVSHNVNGAKERLNAGMTWMATKLETIAAYMLKCLINIYLIQETWLEGSKDFTIGEITFLMHDGQE
jgi:hypothetical protein